jgi:parallel beta-helix repeat protein
MNKLKISLFVFLYFILIFSGAYAQTYISSCRSLDQSGTYYLTTDLINVTDRICMNIITSNVVLDCQGHRIDGVDGPIYWGGQIGIYINNGSSNVIVKDCFLSDFERGIDIEGSYNVISNIGVKTSWIGINISGLFNRLYNINTSGNIDIGVYVTGSSNEIYHLEALNNNFGVIIEWTNNNTINYFKISKNKARCGVWIMDSYNNFITNGLITDSYKAVCLTRSYSDYLSNLTIRNNEDVAYLYRGVVEFYSSNSNLFENSIIESNYEGIGLLDSGWNIIRRNLVVNNSDYGIVLSSAGSWGANYIYDNIFNNTVNFYFEGGIYKNYWNITLSKGSYIPGDNVWRGIVCVDTNYDGICDFLNITPTTATNIVGGPYIGGNYWGSPDGIGFSDTCVDSDKNGICDGPYYLNDSNIDYLPLSKYSPPPPTTTIPFNYTAPTGAFTLIPLLLGNPLFFVIVFGLALATAIESKIHSGGWAFLLTFIGVLLMFSIFGGVVPLWFVLVLIAIVIGGIVFLKRG